MLLRWRSPVSAGEKINNIRLDVTDTRADKCYRNSTEEGRADRFMRQKLSTRRKRSGVLLKGA